MKPFKGYVTLELSDGQKQTQKIEGHNMVTKALEYFYKQGGMTNPSAFNANLIRTEALKYLLGGVMCLDTALTESNEIIRVPAGVGMTANGARDVVNTENPPELGSYNTLESGWQNDGSFKMVWDWNTAQGNGTIACVCLTSEYWGMAGNGNPSDTGKVFTNISSGSYNAPTGKGTGSNRIAIGLKNNVLTMMQYNIAGSEAVTISKYKFPFDRVDIRNTIGSELISEISVALPNNVKNLSGLRPIVDVYYKGDYAYILVGDQPNVNYPSLNGTAYALVYDLGNDEFVSATEISITVEGQNVQCVGISDKWVILSHYAIELANTVNVIDLTDNMEIIHEGFGSWFARLTAVDSKIFIGRMSGRNVGMIIDVENETVHPTNINDDFLTIGEPAPLLRLTWSGDVSILRDPRYIATIFNLDSPVTKDASKTMKVTYVLRFS